MEGALVDHGECLHRLMNAIFQAQQHVRDLLKRVLLQGCEQSPSGETQRARQLHRFCRGDTF